MVVIAIIAGVLAFGGQRLFSSSASMRASVRQLAVSTREIRNVARLYNTTQRLVISANEKERHSYWVESAPGDVTLMSREQQEEFDKLTSVQQEDKAPKSEWTTDGRVIKSPVELPKGLFFGEIEYSDKERLSEDGIHHVHFFPQGLSDQVAIHLTDKKTLNWTITIHPLTGRADVYEKKISLQELNK